METNISLSRLKEPEFFPEFWKTIMTEVVAFVDVRTGSDNRSKSIANEMERMGATVVQHFSKKVTHVIFKDGSKPIYDKAKALGIPIVSYLWVVACKEKGEMVSTEEHAAINSQDYDSEFFKWRKVKSMQPKELDEELQMAEKRLDRRRKKFRQSLLLCGESSEEPLLHFTPIAERKSIIDTLIESSPACQERIQQQLASGKTCDDVFTVNEKEEEDFDTFFDTPLMIKFISKNYYSPMDPTPSSIRKILANVRQTSAKTATTPSMSNHQRKGDVSSGKTSPDKVVHVTLPGSPLGIINKTTENSNKRKTCSSMSSTAKRRKENAEHVVEKLPRRKLLFQPTKLHLPQDPLVALTPDESPKKEKKNHPCFSQVGINVKSHFIPYSASGKLSPRSGTSPRRDSLADFKRSIPKKRNDQRLSSATLVCTSLHSEPIKIVEKAIEQMKRFKLIDTVDDTTTHVICGDSRRTLNVMRGVVRGAKIVTFNWITDSMASGKFLNEDDYQIERFSNAASLYRGKNKCLFGDYEAIFVSSKSPIPSPDLCDMIQCAGGNLTSVSKKASLIVGQLKPEANVPCVASIWILDCIEKGVILPLTDYLMKRL
ncbi:microcephalin [Daphnia magna]|uniref:Microcephalin n=2 Tax=Daphnia magna TaxID=35525 RepID=A0A0P5YS15_9CRUS|nr:microcephalin [Daphnia magna]KAK4002058.1 hypothetical protein OUZ56_003916 [Daphnia magna]KZS18437.1 Uncharacterized protein APZ42_014921 [Daphnia magna]